jgi:flotillin
MILIGIGIIAVLFVIFIAMSYVKCPPDMVYLISGVRKEAKVVTGKATLRIPFLERIDRIPLKLIQIDVKTNNVPTNDFINVDVDAVANVRISTKPELIRVAAKHFLNQNTSEISNNVQQILEGNMREIIGQMQLVDLVNNKQLFSQKIQENAMDDIEKLGLEIVNLNVQNCTDDNDAIVNLGVDNLVKIQKDAKIAKAKAEKEIKIAEAQADEEGAKARAEADAKIAEQNKELQLKKAQYKIEQDNKKAEADAAYGIQQAQQMKTVNETQVAAEVAKAEKMTELKEREVALKEKELDALVRKQADAEKYAAEVKAEAEKIVRKQQAEADLIEAENMAQARIAEAKAKKEADELEAQGIRAKLEAEAAGKKAILEAEAAGIKAKALAEAEGIDKKAEAMRKYGEAAVVEMIMAALPSIAKNVAEPLSKVDKITMYGEGNSAKLISDIVNGTTQITEGISSGMGIDIKSLIMGALGGKLASQTPDTPNVVVVQPTAEAPAKTEAPSEE